MGLVQGVLDDWFTRNYEERPPDGYLHPSSLSGCARQAIYESTGTPRTDERDVRSMRIMRMGTEAHGIIQDALDASGLTGIACEVPVGPIPVGPTGGVQGSADAVWQCGEGEWEVIEIKSISPFALKRKGLPQPQHVKQARIYMWGLRQGSEGGDPGVNVVRARIVYVTRDDLEIRSEHEYPIPHDPAWDTDFEAEMRLWGAMLGTRLLPPRIGPDDDMAWLCKYCPWRTRCWDKDQERIRIPDPKEGASL